MQAWVEALHRRHLVQDATPLPENPKLLGAAYVGIDPTADSLHIGHLAPLQLLYHLANMGVQPIVVVGGATARIGDPSGKKTERPLLPPELVQANAQALTAQVQALLPVELTIVDNLSWLGEFSFLDFLREVGKHLTVSYLLAKETIQSRLESGISFTEFAYPLLQAYDFYYLFAHYGCRLQIGGADQWGNITTGIELIRKLTGQEAYGLTCPLLTRADGTKFGKSERGENIWLSPARTSPYQFYQFWLRQRDADMAKLLWVFSWEPPEKIAALLEAHAAAPEKRLAQRALAYEMTARIHGEGTATSVERVSEVVYGTGALEELTQIPESLFAQVLLEMPTYAVTLADGPVVDVLVGSGAFRSKSEVRQLIQQGGLSINRARVDSPETPLRSWQPLRGAYWLVQRGKRERFWLRWEGASAGA